MCIRPEIVISPVAYDEEHYRIEPTMVQELLNWLETESSIDDDDDDDDERQYWIWQQNQETINEIISGLPRGVAVDPSYGLQIVHKQSLIFEIEARA